MQWMVQQGDQLRKRRQKKIRVQLRKRKIPEENYIEAPEHWDFNDITESGLQRGIEVILMSPNTVTPG